MFRCAAVEIPQGAKRRVSHFEPHQHAPICSSWPLWYCGASLEPLSSYAKPISAAAVLLPGASKKHPERVSVRHFRCWSARPGLFQFSREVKQATQKVQVVSCNALIGMEGGSGWDPVLDWIHICRANTFSCRIFVGYTHRQCAAHEDCDPKLKLSLFRLISQYDHAFEALPQSVIGEHRWEQRKVRILWE